MSMVMKRRKSLKFQLRSRLRKGLLLPRRSQRVNHLLREKEVHLSKAQISLHRQKIRLGKSLLR